jgi:DNA processing protein
MRSFQSSNGQVTEREALIILNAVAGIGNRRLLKLIEHLGSAERILDLGRSEWAGLAYVPEAVALNVLNFPRMDFLAKERVGLKRCAARCITHLDEDYPSSLRDIPDHPVVLYVRGSIPEHIGSSVAIVGSRSATFYGMDVAGKFAASLAERGIPVVSGLARGIDAAAHRGCLKAEGQTVAVLGCGLDIVYPKENEELFGAITKSGCLISEFPFGTMPHPYHFPRRNRIVSGLAAGVIVVEANIKSGALITASFALEQGKEVFAVPGRIDNALSRGPLALIQQGAKAVISIEDVLDELPLIRKDLLIRPVVSLQERLDGLGQKEKALYLTLREGGPMGIPELEEKSGNSSSEIMVSLLLMQIRRVVKEHPGRIFEALDMP